MNIYSFYTTIGPWVTPAPAAIALAARLYNQQTDEISAWAIAGFSLFALEIVGGLSTEDLMYSWLKREWTWFKVSMLGVAVYAGLGVYALWGLTAWIYVILAVFVHVAVTRKLLRQEIKKETVEDRTLNLQELTFKTEASLKEKEFQLKMEREKTKQIKAEKIVPYVEATSKPTNDTPKKTYLCPYCGVDQGVANRYSVHMRYCKSKPQEQK